MTLLRDNPVARHAGRLASRRGWGWAVPLLLLAAGGLGLALQRYWLELPEYGFLRPQMAVRWVGLTLVALTAVVLPWAAARGALVWRRLERDGHLDEYRRTRLSPGSIAGGALLAALRPVGVLLLVSGLAAGVAGALAGEPAPARVVTAHALLASQALAFAALGMWFAAKVHYPAFAIPLAVVVLLAATGAIGALEPFYRHLDQPERWIYWALLPNPATAVGSALDTDVLRFGWLYQRLRVSEYFYVYPPAWQTAGAYLLMFALLFSRVAARARATHKK